MTLPCRGTTSDEPLWGQCGVYLAAVALKRLSNGGFNMTQYYSTFRPDPCRQKQFETSDQNFAMLVSFSMYEDYISRSMSV